MERIFEVDINQKRSENLADSKNIIHEYLGPSNDITNAEFPNPSYLSPVINHNRQLHCL